MSARRSFNISLPADLADLIERKISAGEYATESEVVSDGLRTLLERDSNVETWLRDEVVPLAQQVEDGTAETMTADDAWKKLQAHMDRRATATR